MSVNKELEKLQEENKRLQRLVGQDYLTGLCTRQIVERRIDEQLQKGNDGMLLVIDVDGFKKINENFGHSVGDAILRELAQLLQRMFFAKDIVGRIGGDEFAVFTSTAHSTQFVTDKGVRIIQQMGLFGERSGMELSVTMGATFVREGDSYEHLFRRADRALTNGKRHGGGRVSVAANTAGTIDDVVREKKGNVTEAIGRDIKLIWNDLREAGGLTGAYCQGYDNFTCIYRFVERGLVRSPSSVFAILLTLTDKKGELLAVELRDPVMQLLSEVTGNSLRIGDVFTRYSSSQFLLMVLDTNSENALRIVERIRFGMKQIVPESLSLDIECAVHALAPILAKEGLDELQGEESNPSIG